MDALVYKPLYEKLQDEVKVLLPFKLKYELVKAKLKTEREITEGQAEFIDEQAAEILELRAQLGIVGRPSVVGRVNIERKDSDDMSISPRD